MAMTLDCAACAACQSNAEYCQGNPDELYMRECAELVEMAPVDQRPPTADASKEAPEATTVTGQSTPHEASADDPSATTSCATTSDATTSDATTSDATTSDASSTSDAKTSDATTSDATISDAHDGPIDGMLELNNTALDQGAASTSTALIVLLVGLSALGATVLAISCWMRRSPQWKGGKLDPGEKSGARSLCSQ